MRVLPPSDGHHPGHSGLAGLTAWSQDVRAAVRRLEPNERRVIQLVYFERRTQQQVAEELSLPRRTVARALATGMQALALLILAPATD